MDSGDNLFMLDFKLLMEKLSKDAHILKEKGGMDHDKAVWDICRNLPPKFHYPFLAWNHVSYHKYGVKVLGDLESSEISSQ